LDDRNTFDEPEKVKIEEGEAKVMKDEAALTVKPHSVNVIILKQTP
jgi:alpha-L-arabinofuranosidase